MEFKLNSDNRLYMLSSNQWISVELKSCFPLTHPNEFYSIRDEKKKEVALLNDLAELDEVNQEIIQKYLSRKNFTYEIIGIYDVVEEFGVRNYKVKTSSGDRLFQTELDYWPVQQKNKVLIHDLFGDQYFISNLQFGNEILSRYC